MDRTERFYKIEQALRTRQSVRFDQLQEMLDISAATLKRDLQYLRDRLHVPIEWDAVSRGYRLLASEGKSHPAMSELPGLWFSEPELYALLLMHQLVSTLDEDGVLSRHLQPVLTRLHGLVGASDEESARMADRIVVSLPTRRPHKGGDFETIAAALVHGRRVLLNYHSRGSDRHGQREVSPQRLIHYRGTWYLDAWCHQAAALRRFAFDSMETVEWVDRPTHWVSLAQLHQSMDAGFGIYSAPAGQQQWAHLMFEARAAQWVSRERWHPDQIGQWCADGRWSLKVPYGDPTELVMDILRHGDQVEVLGNEELRQAVEERLSQALKRYRAAPA